MQLIERLLLPDGWKVLVDAPMDGMAEEFCWVPVGFAATEDEAIALARAERVADEHCTLTVTGREHWRRDPAYKPIDGARWHNQREDVTTDYEPWLPCSKYAKTGIEVWRIEVDWEPALEPHLPEEGDHA